MPNTVTGGCACGAVRYEYSADPVFMGTVIAVIVKGLPAVLMWPALACRNLRSDHGHSEVP